MPPGADAEYNAIAHYLERSDAERNALMRYLERCGAVSLRWSRLHQTAREIGFSARAIEHAIDSLAMSGRARVDGEYLRPRKSI